MSKKIFIGLLLALSIIFSYTYIFANDNLKGAANTVKNVVGGAENTVENVARGVSNTSKNATEGIENAGKNMTDNMGNNAKNTVDNIQNTTMMGSDNNNENYSATRTAANVPTFMGMTSTGWTWLILGIVAVAIIGLVWYYSMQLTGNNYNNRSDD